MLDRIVDTIEKYNLIEQGDGIVVGLSGGPDSVCLLHALHAISSRFDIKLYPLHINHMLRGAEADLDQKYAEELCRSLGLPFYCRAIEVAALAAERKLSVEEAGREARYHEFRQLAGQTGATKIAVAHNRNDQAETILLRLIRGTGLDGLKGISYKRGNIIRPLLDIERHEIEEYCRVNNLAPRTDSSNLEDVYMRNKVRLDLIPFINRSFDTDITRSLSRMASLIRQDADFLDEITKEYYSRSHVETTESQVVLDITALASMHRAGVRRVIRMALENLKGDLKGIENVHIDKTVELAIEGSTGSSINLPSGIKAEKSYQRLILRKADAPDKRIEYCYELRLPGETPVEELGYVFNASIMSEIPGASYLKSARPKGAVQFFDYEKLKSGINIRNRRNGDVFKPFGSRGTKKLKEFFIDEKIPREVRAQVPLVATGNEIVWIVGYRTSDKFKVTDNTKSVLRLECCARRF